MAGLNPKTRTAIVSVVAGAGVLVITQFVLPGSGTEDGTPPAILFQGVVSGLLNALLAVGLVLIYRSSRIINFAQGALGGVGGVFTYNLAVLSGWPFLAAFAGGVIAAGLLGLVVQIAFIRRFFNSPRLVLTVLTIALLSVIGPASGYILTLPIFPDIQDRTAEQLQGQASVNFPFNDFRFQIGSTPLDFRFGHLFALAVAAAAMIGLAAFLRYAKSGTAIRASAENSDRALLLGINVGTLSMIVWTIAGVLSGLAVILSGVVSSSFSGGFAPPEVLLTALAAAVIARMYSMPVAIASAIGLTVLREAIKWSFEEQLVLLDAGIFVAILVALLVQQRRVTRSEGGEASAWKASEEARATPKEMLAVSSVRLWRRGLIVTGILILIGVPFVLNTRQLNLAGYALIIAIASLSLVVLTGWAGQVSLGQFAFVAIGAAVAAGVSSRYSFWAAVPVAPFVTAAFAVLVGIPALRIKGLFLGITTFALAFAVNAVLFDERYFGWLLPESVDRPSFFILDFEDERSMYYLALAGLLIAVLLVTIMRRSRPGRVLIAVRENEANIQSFGVNLLRAKLAAFALSGFLCGFCGLLLAHHQRAVQNTSFGTQLSLDVFLYTVVGGVGSVPGALMGAGYFALTQLISDQGVLSFLIGPVGVVIILYFVPGGLASIFFGFRDAIYRIVAQRRQLIVPSLFADYDPLLLARKLIPLSEPIPSAGLSSLPVHQRYRTIPSMLYSNRGRLVAATASVSSEAKALGGAAKSLLDSDEEPEPLIDVTKEETPTDE